jgi:exodeoxyribonuclease VII small subunit
VANETRTETYKDVVDRLEDVVKRLEGGDLSLEDSLKAFEDGIRLVRRGEQLLSEAEKRVEQLLAADGEDAAVPLELPATAPPSAPAPSRSARNGNRPTAAPPPPEDDDVPF